MILPSPTSSSADKARRPGSNVVSEKSALIRGEVGRQTGHISGYCDECGEWTDLLLYNDGTFTCEECRGESSST